MIKTHKQKIEQEIEIIDEIKCNCCGGNIGITEEEYISFDHKFGYFSDWFDDGEEHKFHICENCYFKIIDSFKIPPCGFDKSKYPF